MKTSNQQKLTVDSQQFPSFSMQYQKKYSCPHLYKHHPALLVRYNSLTSQPTYRQKLMEDSAFFHFFAFLLLHCFMASLTVAVRTNITIDQSALLALKAHITDDLHEFLATNWSTSTSVCNWIGITCGAKHLRVTALN